MSPRRSICAGKPAAFYRCAKNKQRERELKRAGRGPHAATSGRPAKRPYMLPHHFDDWFKRVSFFCNFTTPQKNSGQAIIKELKKRADQKEKVAKSAKRADIAEYLDQLQAELFAELHARVRDLLTPEQRKIYAKEAGLEPPNLEKDEKRPRVLKKAAQE